MNAIQAQRTADKYTEKLIIYCLKYIETQAKEGKYHCCCEVPIEHQKKVIEDLERQGYIVKHVSPLEPYLRIRWDFI